VGVGPGELFNNISSTTYQLSSSTKSKQYLISLI
jgi:hypothetical protein